ncbi:MAG TPA: TRAP transporter substrate-binding protein [Burkholderiales bacterium]|nr:TRAP transporter substrate-binding protein [Burkholderiales bacterium]
MKRLAIAALASAFAVPAGAQTVLKVHSFSSPQAPDQALHLFPWAEKVNKSAGGKLKVEVYPSMQLGGKPADLPQQLEDGVVDLIFHLPGFSPGRFPGMEGTELPFTNVGVSAGQSPAIFEWANRWLRDSEFKGIRILSIHATDASILHTRERAIRTLEDFKGAKLRVPGRFVGEAAKALGATPVGIPLPGVYEALARGQVDGMFINWAIMPAYRFHEVTKHHMETPVYQSALMTLMSQRSYDKLPVDLKKAIDDNSGLEYTKHIGKVWDGLTEGAKKQTRDAGNNVFTLSEAEQKRWADTVRPVYGVWVAEMNKRGLAGQKMLDDLLATTAKYGRK